MPHNPKASRMLSLLLVLLLFFAAGCHDRAKDVTVDTSAIAKIYPSLVGIEGGHLIYLAEWRGFSIIYGHIKLNQAAVDAMLEENDWVEGTAIEVATYSRFAKVEYLDEDGKIAEFLCDLYARDQIFLYCEEYSRSNSCFSSPMCDFPFQILSTKDNILYVYEVALVPYLVGELEKS